MFDILYSVQRTIRKRWCFQKHQDIRLKETFWIINSRYYCLRQSYKAGYDFIELY